MRLKKNSSEQKLRGAYYTPLQLADAMVGLFASQDITTVLEPSCGDGVFLDSLKNLKLLDKVRRVTAVEIAPDEAEKVRSQYSDFGQVEVCTEDFFNYYYYYYLQFALFFVHGKMIRGLRRHSADLH